MSNSSIGLTPFWRRVSTVMAGTIAAQLIPLASLPILTRLLPPTTLGDYYIWLGAATIASVAASLRFDVAVFSARSIPEVAELVMTASMAGIVVALASLGMVKTADIVLGRPLIACSSSCYLLEAAILAYVSAMLQILLSVHIYQVQFGKQAVAKVILAVSVTITQLLAVIAGFGLGGLIYGQVLASASVLVWLFLDIERSLSRSLRHLSPRSAWRTIRNNWRFPVLAMPADAVNSLSAQLPFFMLAGRFGPSASGYYALTNRALAAPVGLLAGSILTVFKEQASQNFRDTGNCVQVYIATLRSLALLGLAPFAFLWLFAEPLFILVFGETWAMAGRLGEILAPMFYLKFVASPLSYTLFIADRQAQDLYWQLGLLATTFAALHLTGSVESAVTCYSLGYSLLYIVYLRMSYVAARGIPK